MSVLLLGLFRQCMDRQGALGKFLSRNAYGVYISYAALIVPLALALSGIALGPC
jgi:hypothetical protein